jgi:hypothetical protein
VKKLTRAAKSKGPSPVDHPMSDPFALALARLRVAAEGLPEVEESISYGTPSLRVRKKSFCRIKDPDTVVLMCPLEEKELLMEAAPDLYFETDHYKGWPAVLARIHQVRPDELRLRLRRAYVMYAPKSLAKTLLD